MGNIKIKRGVFDSKLELEHAGIKHDFKSPNPTTRWSDIIKLK